MIFGHQPTPMQMHGDAENAKGKQFRLHGKHVVLFALRGKKSLPKIFDIFIKIRSLLGAL